MTVLFFILVGIFIILCIGWVYSMIKASTTEDILWLNRMLAFTFAVNINNLIIQILIIIMKTRG